MKKKIAVVVSLAVVLMFTVLIALQTLFIGQEFKKSIGNESETHVERIAGAYSLAIANKVNEYLGQVRFYTDTDAVSTGNDETIISWLQSHAGARRSYFSYIMYVNSSGDFFTDIGTKGNVLDSETYNAIFSEGKNEYVSNPSMDLTSGKSLIYVARAAKVQGKIIGYFAAAVPVENFQYMTEYIQIGSDGIGAIVTDKGLIMAYKNRDYTMKTNLLSSSSNSIKTMANALVKGGIGTDWVDNIDGKGTDFIAYSPIPNTHWSFCVIIPQSQIYASHDALISKLIIFNVGICIVLLLVTIVITSSILRPLVKVRDSIRDIASGSADLTSRIKVSTKNEIGAVVEGFNAFTEKLQSIVKKIKESEDSLNESGNELNDYSINAKTSIKEIVSSISSMNNCISDQTEGVLQTVVSVNEITEGLQNFEALIESQSAGVAQASSAVEEMIGNINSVNASVEKMAAQFQELEQMAIDGAQKQNDVNGKINLIESESQMLQEANSAIASIAEQTNLLAMNAAIEAAHAGEAGKGFSVVADEIRKLSETSSEQSNTIGKQLKNIKDSIESVVSASESSSKAFTSVVEGIKSTDNIVQQIHSAMLEQAEGSKQINDALRDMNSSTTDVRSASKNMANSNQSVLSQVQKLENSTETMKSNMDNMKEGAEKIGNMGEALSQITEIMKNSIDGIGNQISQFKV